MPLNQTLLKSDIVLKFNGINYSWNAAVQNEIILGFIYGWNKTTHMYMISDVFKPGNGYWMFAYYQCILVRN